jgi:Tfp pilus assembly protein PilF
VAFDEPGREGLVQQTGGVLSQSAKAIEDGTGKITQALKPPPPPVVPADDPTSVFTKAKPTPELYIAMARYYEQNGQVSQADQAYQRGLKLAPKHLSVLLNYARFKDRLGQRQEAMDLYQRALKLYPKEASLYNDLGLFFARQGNSREAIGYYQRAIQLQPSRALYRHNLAIVLVDSGQPEKAMEHLMAAGNEAEACYKMGYLLQKKGQLPEAAAYFERATRLDPAMQEAKLWLAHVRGQVDASQRMALRPEPPSSATSPPRGPLPVGSSAPRSADPPPPAGRAVTPLPPPATEETGPRVGPRAAPSDKAAPGARKGPAAPQRLPLPAPWEEKRMYDEPSPDAPPLPPPTSSGPPSVGARGALDESLDDFPPLPDDVLGGLSKKS